MARRDHNRVKKQQFSREYLKQLNTELIIAKKVAKEGCMKSIIGAGGLLTDGSRNFYGYVIKMRGREGVDTIIDKNGEEVTEDLKRHIF